MHVLFVSACEKRALSRTRALLDSYAVRTSATSWATPITVEALEEVRRALRRGATRQTAVACYANHGYRRMRLLWVVGARGRFGTDGHFPAGTKRVRPTAPDLMPGWLRVGRLLVRASGFMHDIGKASVVFRDKLAGRPLPHGDDIRHEWLSMRLVQEMRAFRATHPTEVHKDLWEQAWQAVADRPMEPSGSVRLGNRVINGQAREAVADPLEAIDYLVVSHHGLLQADAADPPPRPGSKPLPVLPTACPRHVRRVPCADQVRPAGLVSAQLFARYWRLEERLQRATGAMTPLQWRALLLLARPALVMADHLVSAKTYDGQRTHADLYANTTMDTGTRRLNQPLDWHLEHVGDRAAEILLRLAALLKAPARNGMPGLSEASMEAIGEDSHEHGRFAWQNRAAHALSDLRKQAGNAPVLVFNVAATGSGKTRMNIRGALALATQREVRISVALNLRSLTLQTGEALRSGLGLGGDDLAVVIGDAVTQRMFEHALRTRAGGLGETVSAPVMFADDDENPVEQAVAVAGAAGELPSWMDPLARSLSEAALLSAPILVSTMDYLVKAGEPGEQGHHVRALLRVITGDLILDEIDSYEPEALVAVLRVVQIAAFAGRNVICSSATLSEPVARAVHRAFRSGAQLRACLDVHGAGLPHGDYRYAFIDDRVAPLVSGPDELGEERFAQQYHLRLRAIVASLQSVAPTRLAFLQPIGVPLSTENWMQAVCLAVRRLHGHWSHTVGPDRRMSFGLVRVANVRHAVLVARRLARCIEGARVCCYHAKDFVASRQHKEQVLDRLLARSNGDAHLLQDPEVASHLACSGTRDTVFIVVATPVEEIGRDHDFDWAVVDVSSAQSVVQTGGRVNRHRLLTGLEQANLAILQFNFRHCENAEKARADAAAFIRPGYEKVKGRGIGGGGRKPTSSHREHDVSKLLPWDAQGHLPVDARIRFEAGQDGVRLCRLAEWDDVEIEARLAPFFGVSGAFVGADGGAWLLTGGPAGPYALSPLRGIDRHIRVLIDEAQGVSQLTVQTDAWDDRLRRVIQVRRVEEPLAWREAVEQAWLNSSVDGMRELCRRSGVAGEEGLVATLEQYCKDTGLPFEFDEGFGFFRPKAGAV